ncbi:transmembrane protein, putative (macronuclear) [Tetrahymena thermophila SB210]|uniref:Transmembrane protein, putative n=1 Tax=Tetrahymena thermophila (strain SB210) TaxID=312017 RepID=W7XKF8_TETTS|nr:transmembrane protein, putative [Tetrahymena thermophila SB210]EWS74864.1 transmembrane protein, putative [Tetrahymena thermophila SB210]|eukprot:XP_012652577.1 transmembrane protein, putative [Tetrahymena thermophila SB210]
MLIINQISINCNSIFFEKQQKRIFKLFTLIVFRTPYQSVKNKYLIYLFYYYQSFIIFNFHFIYNIYYLFLFDIFLYIIYTANIFFFLYLFFCQFNSVFYFQLLLLLINFLLFLHFFLLTNQLALYFFFNIQKGEIKLITKVHQIQVLDQKSALISKIWHFDFRKNSLFVQDCDIFEYKSESKTKKLTLLINLFFIFLFFIQQYFFYFFLCSFINLTHFFIFNYCFYYQLIYYYLIFFLQYLISDNKIGDSGASSLGSNLEKCTNVSSLTLQLSNCGIRDQCVSYLCSGLGQCTNLSNLKLDLRQKQFIFSIKLVTQSVSSFGSDLRKCTNLSSMTLSKDFNLRQQFKIKCLKLKRLVVIKILK